MHSVLVFKFLLVHTRFRLPSQVTGSHEPAWHLGNWQPEKPQTPSSITHSTRGRVAIEEYWCEWSGQPACPGQRSASGSTRL